MPVEMLRRLIQEAARWGAQLKMGQADEPLVYPKLPELLREAKEAGVPRIHITTNGSLLNEKMRDAMIRYVDRVQVSLDAATEASYRQIRLGKKAHFPTIVENVRSLIRERNRRLSLTPEVMPVMILQEPAIAERQQFMDTWLPVADGVIFNSLTVVRDGVDFTQNPNSPKPEPRLICADPWLAPFVLPDGEVIFCCESLEALPRQPVAQLTLGDIRERSLRDVWLGEDYRRLREANLFFDWKKSPLCEKCIYWTNHYSRRLFENGLRVQETYSIRSYFRE
jgi:MoaA/NifB/PqqE/SkfB family radical SAM enzyme